MLIDAILDRKYDRENGVFNYVHYKFYNYINGWAYNAYSYVCDAMLDGDESAVKKALCFYIDDSGYNPEIKDFINSVDWLTSDPQEEPRQEIFQTIRAYKSREDMYANNPLDLKFIVNKNWDYRERYEKEYAAGVAWGLTVKYAHPVVAVLTTIDGKTEVTEVHQARRSK